jgi:ComF family protein
LRAPPSFDATLTLADYTAPIDGLIVALKFGHRLELAPVLGDLLAARARGAIDTPVVVPVPLSFERLAERGFNQASELARATARALGAPFDDGAVTRIRHAAPQASLSLEARRRNIRGAFLVRRNVHGLHVAVVDDVMTSGSTLDEVARVLKAAGAGRVTNLVIARTP